MCTIRKQKKCLGCSEFKAWNVPNPVVTYVGKQGGSINKELLTKATLIEAKPNKMDFVYDLDMNFRILTYSFRIVCKEDTVLYKGIGNRFTPEITEALSNLESGTKFFIENVVIYTEDIGYRTLDTIMFKVE